MAAHVSAAAAEATWWADATWARDTFSFDDDNALDDALDDASDAEDDRGDNLLTSRVRDGRTRIVRLPDGDIHVCDDACEYAEAGSNAITNLRREAALIFDKLITTAAAATGELPNNMLVGGAARATEHSSLMRHDVLFSAALRKYLKEVAACRSVPSLDDINNISLAVHNVLTDHAKHAESAARAKDTARVRNVEFRSLVVTLAVSLFQCASTTPYMQSVRRGADAFRPFCAGVCYAFKRGLELPNGTVLIPKCETFVHALADARGATTNARLKSLHASSHKGMCTLHRSIASVPPDAVHVAFDAAIRAGSAVAHALAV